MEINTFGWCMLALCGLVMSLSATLSMEYIHERKGKHYALLWLVLNMAAISIPATLLVSLSLAVKP